jgi:outer membrane receptor protein involved in Fe transport
MKKNYKNLIITLGLSVVSLVSFAQSKTMAGKVTDNAGTPIQGVSVAIVGSTNGTNTDSKGNYEFTFESNGLTEVTLVASFVGYEKSKVEVNITGNPVVQNFTLTRDEMGFKDVVVTGVTNPKSKLESSVSISSLRLDQINQGAPRSTAEIFRSIPGIRSEASAGEGNTNITVRGVPISSGGSKYLQLQEDGLPVLQFGDIAFATSDIFLRADNSISRIEAIRGGSASTMATNSPAGIINFISKNGSIEGGSVTNSFGLDYRNFRTDFDYGAPISKDLSYHIAGFFRNGEGVRTAGFNANNGGQIKANVTKSFKNGYFKVYLKYLDDRAAAYMPMPVEVSGTNANPTYTSLPNFDASYGALQSKYMMQNVGLGGNGEYRKSDVADGMHPVSKSFGTEFSFDLGQGWSVENRNRFSLNSGGFIAPFPAAVGNTADIINQISGAKNWALTNPNLTYANDNTAFTGDKAMIIHMFDTELKNFNLFTNDFKIKKKVNNNLTVNGGVYKAYQNIAMNWLWNSYLTDVNGNGARPINIDTGRALTQGGQFAYGVPVWGNCCTRSYDVKYDITAPYAGVAFELKNVSVDASVRWDMGNVTGNYAGASQSSFDVNRDSLITANELSVSSINNQNAKPVNYMYDYLSYSMGVNYKLNNSSAVFGRYSQGAVAKADRILFGDNVLKDGSARGMLDRVNQAELGLKHKMRKGGIFLTGFYANTNEEGGFEATTQQVIENDYSSFGAELEAVYNVYKNFDLRASATWTKAEITSGPNKGKTPRRQADVIYNLFANYRIKAHSVGLSFIGTTSSFASDENKLIMPGYAITNAYVNFGLTKHLFLSLNVNNLLNTTGFTESEEGSIVENQKNINLFFH